MMHSPSLWRVLAHGLVWGLGAAFLLGLAAPLLLTLDRFITTVLGGMPWGDLASELQPISWAFTWLLMLLYLGVPGLTGGFALALALRLFAPGSPAPQQLGLWTGVGTGCFVVWIGLGGMVLTLGIPDWLWLFLMTLWSTVLYGWVGWRLARPYERPPLTV